ncbi:MAG: hypothetical protein HETSPECPRED_000315 [Heterodermia speciosa]|uniref:Uncharacterized protein n=1 Tax=Heterodermia speciosa TaxID=116794 RepID=A0A8H3ERE5_9LECA|nr:MAG: hypothetical protein HETSPECPRED_000315 [Heterodermia speciosa]
MSKKTEDDHYEAIHLADNFRLRYLTGAPNARTKSDYYITFTRSEQRELYVAYMESKDYQEVLDRITEARHVTKKSYSPGMMAGLVRFIIERTRRDRTPPSEDERNHWNFVTESPGLDPGGVQRGLDALRSRVRDVVDNGNVFVECYIPFARIHVLKDGTRSLLFNGEEQAFIYNAITFARLSPEDTVTTYVKWVERFQQRLGKTDDEFDRAMKIQVLNILGLFRYIKHRKGISPRGSVETEHWRRVTEQSNHLLAEIRVLTGNVDRDQRAPLLQRTYQTPYSTRDTTGEPLQPSQKRRAAHTLDSESSGSRASSSSLEPKMEKALNDMNLRHKKEGEEEFDAAYDRGGREAIKGMAPPHNEESRERHNVAYRRGGEGAAFDESMKTAARQVHEKEEEIKEWKKKKEAKNLRRLERERQGKERRAQKPFSQVGQYHEQLDIPERTAGSRPPGSLSQDPYSQGRQHGYQSNAPQSTTRSGTSGFLYQDRSREGRQYDDQGIEITGREDAQRQQEEIEGIYRESAALMGGRPPTNTPRRKEEVPQNPPQDKTGRPRRKKPSGH